MTTYSFYDRSPPCSGAQRNAASEPFSETHTGNRQNSELNVDGAWWRQSGRQEYLDIEKWLPAHVVDTLRPTIMAWR